MHSPLPARSDRATVYMAQILWPSVCCEGYTFLVVARLPKAIRADCGIGCSKDLHRLNRRIIAAYRLPG
jgi:hypothetical protein